LLIIREAKIILNSRHLRTFNHIRQTETSIKLISEKHPSWMAEELKWVMKNCVYFV